MPLYINTNVNSLTAQRHLGNNTNMLQKSMERLSSGFRINRAGDDAAGLQLSETLRAQIRGSQKALANVQDGLGVLNIADGAYDTIESNLQRIRELTVQGANDTYNASERNSICSEINQLLADIQRIGDSTAFNGVKLVDGSAAAFNVQVGPNGVANIDNIDLVSALGDIRPITGLTTFTSLVVTTAAEFASNSSAQGFLQVVDGALDQLNQKRGALGAFMNRLEGTANNLSISIENMSASESRIRNVDVASESAKLTQAQILQQASSTILAQANQTPALALQLLKGG